MAKVNQASNQASNQAYHKLAQEAVEARKHAYAPYSGFKVGAALLAKDGKIYHGCNIENAAYSPTNCAERTAFFSAIAGGQRHFEAIAIAGWAEEKPGHAFPCGVCRQVMMEFCLPETFRIIVTDGASLVVQTLAELLPNGFGPHNL